MNVSAKLTRTWSQRALVALVVMVAVIGCAVPTAATPSPPPAAYYGNLTVNGDAAPAGLTITAKIDGEARGSLTTSQPGVYGGSGGFDPKLQVDGQNSDEGATVRFFVEGQPAGTTTWHSGDVRAVDLSATGVDLGSVGGTETPQDTGDSGSSDGSSGGGGSGGASGTGDNSDATQTPSSTAVPTTTPVPGASTGGSDSLTSSGADRILVTTNGSSTSVNVTGSRSGQQVTVNLSTPNDTGTGVASSSNSSNGSDNVTFDGLVITPEVGGNFTLDVSFTETVPAGTPTLPGGVSTIGSLVVNHSLPDDDIDGITFTFSVRKSRLAATGIAPENVTLYRLHDGTWTELQTTLEGETPTHYVFETTSPGLSVFALGTKSITSSSQGDASEDSTAESTTTDSMNMDTDVGTSTTATQRPTGSSVPTVGIILGVAVALVAALLAVRRYR